MKALLIALTMLASAFNAFAQIKTQNELDWAAIQAAKAPNEQINIETATALYNKILLEDSLNTNELIIIQTIARLKNPTLENEIVRQLAASDKQGNGILTAKAIVKFWDKELNGWTNELINVRPDLASALALLGQASPTFKTSVFNIIKEKSCSGYNEKRLFKEQRALLTKEEQVELTRIQKQLMIAFPNRDSAANAWLAEVSADLVALELD